MEVIVRNAKQGALVSATISHITACIKAFSGVIAHELQGQCQAGIFHSRKMMGDIIKLLTALQGKLEPTN